MCYNIRHVKFGVRIDASIQKLSLLFSTYFWSIFGSSKTSDLDKLLKCTLNVIISNHKSSDYKLVYKTIK